MQERFELDPIFTDSALEAWQKVIEKDLKGAPFEKKLVTETYENLMISPVYTPADAPGDLEEQELPGLAPWLRGSKAGGQVEEGWDIRQSYRHPNPAETNREILDDLSGGAHSLWIQVDARTSQGREPSFKSNPNGVCIGSLQDLETLLNGVHLNMAPVAFSAGLATPLLTSLFKTHCENQKIALDEVQVHFGADPLANLARLGSAPQRIDAAFAEVGHLALWLDANMPKCKAITVDSLPYHEAGANYQQELAYAMASATQYLRACADEGLPLQAALNQISFRFGVGNNAFQEIAKLRAARLLWSRIIEVCGGSPDESDMYIHAVASPRALTRRDPYNNILRSTVACFAAGLGGADAVTTASFDQSLGQPSPLGRRIARNTQIILQEESHLHRVIDPAGGSWFIERHTRELAEGAWDLFRKLEANGGMSVALVTGQVADQVAQTWAKRRKNLATTKDAVTGVSAFPQLDEPESHSKAVDLNSLNKTRAEAPPLMEDDAEALLAAYHQGLNALFETLPEIWNNGVRLQSVATALYADEDEEHITPLPEHYLAEPFELLRDASDKAAAAGKRPKVFLANLGKVAQFTARSSYARNFFTAGGFEIISGENLAEDPERVAASFRASDSKIAVICSSDPIYAQSATAVALALKGAGATTVILAGRPGESEQTYRDAGVDRFIFIGCNVLDTLTALLDQEGVLS
jgi:methylmalonyl-CoA mutase